MRILVIFCVALGACCFLGAQTNAPGTSSDSAALAGISASGQTEILSDNGAEFYYKLKTSIFRGNVRANNPQMKLTCELLTVESPEMKEGKFNRATAETNVVIDWVDDTGTNHATAAKAVYTYVVTNLATLPEIRMQTNAFVVLSGDPFVVSARGTFKGDPIIWDRINDVISTPNAQRMTITNSSGMFETSMPKETKPADKSTNKPPAK